MISCMDFRLIDDMVHAMNHLDYNNNYDQFILAGASLGLTQDKFPHWGQAALDHMEIGKQLHQFREIIIFDHMDCGAYKKFHPEMKTREDEVKLHHENLQKAYDMLAIKFPNLVFKAFLMEVSGEYKEVPINLNSVHFDKKHQDAEKTNFLADIKLSTFKIIGDLVDGKKESENNKQNTEGH